MVDSPAVLPKIAGEIAEAEAVGLDIETTAYKPQHGHIRLVQINTLKGVYVIDLFKTKTLDPVTEALAGPAVKIVQAGVFEQLWFLAKYDCILWPLFDTHRASAMIHNGKNLGHNLYDIYLRELGVSPEAPDLGGSDWSGHLTDAQYKYAAEDVVHLPALRQSLKPKLAKAGLNRIALLEFGAILGEAEMKRNGFPLNKDRWLALARDNKEKAEKIRSQLDLMLPHPSGQVSLPGMSSGFNLNSTQQLQKSFKRLGIDLTSTAENVLGMIASKHPSIPKLMEYKKVSKRVSSFGPDYLKHLDEATGRIHCDYWPLTGAGRYSCSDPNLQQIPRTKDFRGCFAPGEGKTFVVCDYGQIELRIAAEITGDKTLRGIYVKGEDAHQRTASLVSNVPFDQVSKEQRQAAKPVNFGLIYGLGWEKLIIYSQVSYGVTLTEGQAKKFIKRYFEAYPAVRAWHDRALRDGQRTHMARTLWGRLRYLDPEKSRNEFFNCVDDETEALTRRGWVSGFDLNLDDELLTKNPDTGELEWQRMTALKRFPDHEGEVWEFRNRSFSAVTTPDHRWLVYNKISKRDEERVSKDLSQWGDHRIHRTGHFRGASRKEVTDDFVELVGWFLTDGSGFLSGTNKTRDTANLYQSARANPHKVAEIDRLLENSPEWLTGRYEYGESNNFQVTWRLEEKISEELRTLFPSRQLTVDFLGRLTRPQLDLLLHTMMAGDGHVEDSGKRTFCCGEDRIDQKEAFQILCTLCGYASSSRLRDFRKYPPGVSAKMQNSPKRGKAWYVTILRRDKVKIQRDHVTVSHRKVPVWCPIVPNTFFVARREGQVYITGNTPVQGTGADGLKRSLPLVYHRLRQFGEQARMVHMVHDEIVVEVDDHPDLVTAVKHELEQGMIEGIQPMLPHVPVEAEAASGPSWAEAK